MAFCEALKSQEFIYADLQQITACSILQAIRLMKNSGVKIISSLELL